MPLKAKVDQKKVVTKSTTKKVSAKSTEADQETSKITKNIKSSNDTKIVKSNKDTKIVKSNKDTKIVKSNKKDIKNSESSESSNVSASSMIKRISGAKKGGYILVIVESPGKIKKLESILGSGYKVASSIGHIMDLYPDKLSVDIENNFRPEYTIIKDKKGRKKGMSQDKTQVVKDLIKLASKADDVILAADKDREGEMIAWSLKEVLGLKDPKRIVFNAITKGEILKAVQNPGKIDMSMVDSQKARRILDRLVGYKVSPELNNLLGMRGLSAGRVQSIVVRLIIDKEEEIKEFFQREDSSYFKFSGTFGYGNNKKGKNNSSTELKADLFTRNKNDQVGEEEDENNENENNGSDEDVETKGKKGGRAKIVSQSKAKTMMNNMTKSSFTVTSVTKRESTRYPPPPHTTSTCQQDASSKLGFNVKRTMQALQKLYEAGLTTYLRTDSTNIATEGLDACEKYIKENFGKNYTNRKNYTDKKGKVQEAHEAIRPTNIDKRNISPTGKLGNDEVRLYNLIWKRTVASQMTPAKVDVYTIEIGISKIKDYYFVSGAEDITFPGFLSVYGIGVHGKKTEDDEDNDEDQFAGVSKVYKFDHSYNLWFHVGNIIMGKARREMAGHSVRICNNGNRIAITIPKRLEENGRILSYVEVYEYKNTDPADKYNGTWELFGQPIKVKSDFGNRISINEDGTIIAVSFLPRNGDGESVKTFKYDPTIDDWEAMGQPIKVKRSTNETPYPVALSSDGETLVVSLADRGEAIVYKFNGDIWKDIHHIQNLNISDQYDASVSISSNGEKILIGAPVHNKNKNNKNTGNISVWSINEKNKLSKMKVDNEGGILNGSNNIVSISNDGNRFIVGNSEQRSFRMYRWS